MKNIARDYMRYARDNEEREDNSRRREGRFTGKKKNGEGRKWK